ncbi:replication initiation protein [Pseudogemmobacter faecipullorum]|uniref:Replication initiation protein n=1 Tax=Pseudogemmobacter faecipullorum TaxID=2755041 RepID=A0ABS8CRF1_9RHOB|nr:replication initiation protein [Pseudogemmobacter faecipullorum]MCB5411964.1 replication initiation protein [Pseudogemmobacter faecipullorum]
MSENRPKTTRTLDVKPNPGEMVKPSELIDVKGATGLTLQDRRIYNILLDNAFGPDLAVEGRRFEIDLADLRDSHDSNDRLIASIEALMKTIVTVARPDGSQDRVQLLGWNNLSDPYRRHGTLKYSIQPELAALLRDSSVFAKLQLQVMRHFTSKYALALYEAISRRVRMQKMVETVSLEDFRDMLGVEPGKLEGYGNLNKFAITPALLEVNALAEFSVSVTPQKLGKRVASVVIGWGMKDIEGRKAAWAELHRPRVGRKARITGTAEIVPLPDSYLVMDE